MKQNKRDLTTGMAIVYARVSTREQAEDGHSITRQISAGEKKAKELGFKLVKVLADEGYSARSLNRPAIQDAIKLIESGFVTAFIIKDLDRLSRDQKNTLAFFSLLEMYDVQLVGTNFDATRENAHQRMVLNIMSAVAQGESEVTGERTIAGIKGGLSKGLYSIPNSPFGYNKNKGKLSINEEEAEIIKEIFYNYGVLDLSTEQVYMIVHAKNKKVTRRQVVYILRDVRYTGIYNYHGETFDNIIPKIIEAKLFDHVQKKLDTNAKRMKHVYHFNRKLYCKECKTILRSTSANSKGTTFLYYTCTNVSCSCYKKSIGNKKMLKALEDEIIKIYNNRFHSTMRFKKKNSELRREQSSFIVSSIDEIPMRDLLEITTSKLPNYEVDLTTKKINSSTN